MGIQWHESLSIGDVVIDGQHKELVSKFDQLLKACEMGQGASELKKLLVFLDEYAIQHFQDEEEIQRRHNYPDYEAHVKEHESFAIRINNLKKDIEKEGVTTQHLVDTNKFLVKWLIHHISSSDAAIGVYIKQKTA
ncbi:bacteriohemerythrin [Pelotalea chapellei]|uniref:Hemerythrin family protein n=1 Tax=Pelotalea chapellei TaxID=44671 RepID=A0ABS5U6I6_9BACT|nr:bacteriohemerythrin [Pelotalea chapellei]MBT1071274.1 hemerythrin family protein [Pelotalea chapellei]